MFRTWPSRSTEVAQLQSLIAGKHDRPAVWAQNLLCFHYGLCSPPHTGGKSSTPKAFPRPENTEGVVEGPQLGLLPNPASVYVAVNYDLKAAADRAYLLVRDLGGREVNMQVLGSAEGQVVIDTRRLPAGVYTVELHNAGQRLLTQKLIVQP